MKIVKTLQNNVKNLQNNMKNISKNAKLSLDHISVGVGALVISDFVGREAYW